MAQFTIPKAAEAEYNIKKSRFIGRIMPCENEQDAIRQLQQLASQHTQANHLAFAWQIKQENGALITRSFDAGEPSGTAGRPILQVIEGAGLINTVIGVIRYFGGVKLGTGGLARAYGAAAKQAYEASNPIEYVPMKTLKLTIEYNQLQHLEYQLKKCNGKIIDQQFANDVQVHIHLPESATDDIIKQFTSY
jgi:uncharacterized YigZ family protein